MAAPAGLNAPLDPSATRSSTRQNSKPGSWVWRAGSEKVLQRAVTEARGNRHTVDIIETNGWDLPSYVGNLSRTWIADADVGPEGPLLEEHYIFIQMYDLLRKSELGAVV